MLTEMRDQLKSSVSGNIESALIIVHDYRKFVAATMSDSKKISALEKVQVISNMRLADTKFALDNGAVFPTFVGSEDKFYHVQFNPSQMTLNASNLPKNVKDADSDESRSLAVEDPRLYLTVSLIFDEMRIYDAFLWEKFTAGITAQSAANLKNFVKEGVGKVWTVQDKVEGLVAALRNPYTRNVSFRWADFSFVGQLNTVQSSYTMFSSSGRPIRAQVQLRLQHEMDPAMLNNWYRDYDNTFHHLNSTLVRTQQNTASLLNLGL